MMVYSKILTICITIIISNGCIQKSAEPSPEIKTATITDADITELYQYHTSDPKSTFEKEQNQIIDYVADKGWKMNRTESGLFYTMTKDVTGTALKHGDDVSAHYKGYFLDGRVFDSSYDRGKPLTFKVGQMIHGWNEALKLMNSGDEAVLLVPSHLGYGEEGLKGFVPPNSLLIFEIKIL